MHIFDSTHIKKHLLVTFCDTTAEIQVSFQTYGNQRKDKRTEGQADVKVEIDLYIRTEFQERHCGK